MSLVGRWYALSHVIKLNYLFTTTHSEFSRLDYLFTTRTANHELYMPNMVSYKFRYLLIAEEVN